MTLQTMLRLRPVALALACLVALGAASRAAADAASGAEQASVRLALGQWLAAWRAQDLDAYLDAYAADARIDARDRAQFAEHKRRIFARGERPRIELGDLEIDAVSEGGERLLRAAFDQDYGSALVTDFGRKELLLRPVGERLLIVRETWRAASGSIAVPFGAPAAGSPAAAATPQPAPAGPAPAGAGVEPVPADPDSRPLLGSEGYVPPAAGPGTGQVPPPGEDLLATKPLLPPAPPGLLPLPGLPPEMLDGGRRVIEEIVARVNGRVLTRSMFLDRIGWYQDTLLAEDPPDLEQRLSTLVAETLATTVDRWVLLQEAKERTADIEGFWREWLVQFRGQVGAKDMAELEQLLSEQGTTLDKLKEQVVETEIPNLFLQQVLAGRLTFSETELRDYFEKNRAMFQPPALVTFKQILIPLAEGVDPSKTEALARHVLDELGAGRDWCDMNSIYGQAGSSCAELTDIALSDLLPELREAAAGLPLGATSKPVRSSQGYHLLRVSARKGAEPVTYEESRELVLRALRSTVFEAEMDRVLAELRQSAEIEINPRYESKEPGGAGGVSQ